MEDTRENWTMERLKESLLRSRGTPMMWKVGKWTGKRRRDAPLPPPPSLTLCAKVLVEQIELLPKEFGLELRHYSDASPEEVISFLSCLSKCSESTQERHMVVLDLECCRLPPSFMEPLCALLKADPHYSKLKRLHLASNRFDFSSLSVFSSFLEKENHFLKDLEVLGLTNNPLEQKKETLLCKPILDILRCRPCLRRVHLNHTGLTTADTIELLTFLLNGCHPALDMVYLKQNENTDVSEVTRLLTDSFGKDHFNHFVKQHVQL